MTEVILITCRGDRTRTCDSLVPNQERYQLRYTPLQSCISELRVQRYNIFPKLPNLILVFFEQHYDLTFLQEYCN